MRLAAQKQPPEAELVALAGVLQGEAELDAEYRQELLSMLGTVREAVSQCGWAGGGTKSEL